GPVVRSSRGLSGLRRAANGNSAMQRDGDAPFLPLLAANGLGWIRYSSCGRAFRRRRPQAGRPADAAPLRLPDTRQTPEAASPRGPLPLRRKSMPMYDVSKLKTPADARNVLDNATKKGRHDVYQLAF